MNRIVAWVSAADARLKPPVYAVQASATAHVVAWIFGIATAISIILTMVQIGNDLAERTEEQATREEERIERAWQRLLLPIAGNTGKGFAVNVLLKAGYNLQDVDLSCRTIGRWDDEKDQCEQGSAFSDVVVPGGFTDIGAWQSFYRDDDITQLEKSLGFRSEFPLQNFNGSYFTNASIVGSKLTASWGNNGSIEFSVSDFSLSNIDASETMQVYNCDASFALIDTYSEKRYANFGGCNFTGAILGSVELEAPPQRSNSMGANWAWADRPPMVLSAERKATPAPESILETLYFCDPAARGPDRRDQGDSIFDGVGWESTGITPNLRDGGRWFPGRIDESGTSMIGQSCFLDWRDAARRYPDRYPTPWGPSNGKPQ